jgi:hypothetical protein
MLPQPNHRINTILHRHWERVFRRKSISNTHNDRVPVCMQHSRDPARVIEWMTDCKAAAVEVDQHGPFCVWLFFVFARGEEGACRSEEVELDWAGEFAGCGWDGEFEGWAGGEGPGEVAVEPGEDVGEEAVAARLFGEVGS